MTDVDEAWVAFRKQNSEPDIKKSLDRNDEVNVRQKLDVLAAQLNEVQTDTKRLAQMIPKIMGDEGAIDTANQQAMSPDMMGGMEGGADAGMGGLSSDDILGGGEDMGAEGGMPEEGMGAEGAEGEDMIPGEENPGETPTVGGDALGGESPDMGAGAVGGNAGGMEDDYSDLFDDEELGGEGAGLGGDVSIDGQTPTEAPAEPPVDAGLGDTGAGAAGGDVMESLKSALMTSIDSGNDDLMLKIVDAIKAAKGGAAPDMGGALPDMTATESPAEEGPAEDTSGSESPAAESSDSGSESSDSESSDSGSDSKSSDSGSKDDSKSDSSKDTSETKKSGSMDGQVGSPDFKASDDDAPVEEKNEEIAPDNVTACAHTKKSYLDEIAETSFRDLYNFKKSTQFGIDGKFAKGLDQLSDLDPSPSMGSADTTSDTKSETADVSDVTSAKEDANAPSAIKTGERTENQTEDNGLEAQGDAYVEMDNGEGEDTMASFDGDSTPEIPEGEGTDVDAEPETAADDGDVPPETPEAEEPEMPDEPLDEENIVKSASLDEVKKPKENLSNGHKPQGGEPLDEVDCPCKDLQKGKNRKPGDLLDDVDEKKGKGTAKKVETLLDQVGEHKGTGTNKNVGDLLDDVGHKKATTEHKTAPGTGLLDDVDEKITSTHKSSDEGKSIMSLREMMGSFQKSSRPAAGATTSGEITRPELGKLAKSASEPAPRMGHGVDPKKVTANDWADYNLFKANRG